MASWDTQYHLKALLTGLGKDVLEAKCPVEAHWRQVGFDLAVSLVSALDEADEHQAMHDALGSYRRSSATHRGEVDAILSNLADRLKENRANTAAARSSLIPSECEECGLATDSLFEQVDGMWFCLGCNVNPATTTNPAVKAANGGGDTLPVDGLVDDGGKDEAEPSTMEELDERMLRFLAEDR